MEEAIPQASKLDLVEANSARQNGSGRSRVLNVLRRGCHQEGGASLCSNASVSVTRHPHMQNLFHFQGYWLDKSAIYSSSSVDFLQCLEDARAYRTQSKQDLGGAMLTQVETEQQPFHETQTS
eukprot:TRINITY_DN36428_c0_g1_i1.p2 TRINITY_DN36428_c0_g1~~TRINITY_DN36428_c0_g1_i1.p2  ORF type:complete len:123 (-),score=7.65 TRINITY_DN36428_c0_g1_i1:228-596(-)